MISSRNYENLILPPVPRSKIKNQNNISYEEMYSLITEVECASFHERLKTAMDKIVLDWTERHDELIDAIDKLENSRHSIEYQYHVQSQQYEKALKETQMYRTRYNHLLRRPSYTSTRSNFNAASDQPSFIYTPLDSTSQNDLDERIFDLSSDLASLPLSPVSPQQNNFDRNTKGEILKFGCSDGFWNAIAQGKSNKEEIESLVSNYLQRGGSPNVAKDSETVRNVKEGYSLVHTLVATKNTTALQSVLQAGANPNVLPLTTHESDKISPLVLAAKVGHMNSVILLVEKSGVDIMEAKGPQGENALHASIQSNSEEIVSYLLRKSQNALLERQDSAGATPLHYAALEGRARLIGLIAKDHTLKLDCQDNKGETPLHYAVRHQKLKVVTKLIELGACPNSFVAKQVPTPLDLAKAGGMDAIARQLRQLGAKTTKELGRKGSTSCSSSTFSGESSGSSEHSNSSRSIRQYFQTKTNRFMKGKQ